MKKKRGHTLSNKSLAVAIPAYNEEKNISFLLRALLSQKEIGFTLKKITVLCDGCTDRTAIIAGEFKMKDNRIMIINDKRRIGKARRLNQLFKTNRSTYLLTIDADIIPRGDMQLSKLVKCMNSNKADLVSGNQVPLPGMSLLGEFANYSFLVYQHAAKQFKNMNNAHLVQGSVMLLRGSFAKTAHIPPSLSNDGSFLYFLATKHKPKAFAFASDTDFLFRMVSTFHDWRSLGKRALVTHTQNVVDYFGKDALRNYVLPKELVVRSIFFHLLKNPIYTLGAILMNVYIRLFPYDESEVKSGVWEIISSTKYLMG